MIYAQSDLPPLIHRRAIFKASSVFSEVRNGIYAVYSYGYHFPLAVYTEDERWLVNIDKYSPSTTRQRRKTGVCQLPDCKFVNTFEASTHITAGNAAHRRGLVIAKITRRLEYACPHHLSTATSSPPGA